MSDTTSPFGFGPFVPGFDFLQSLTRGASGGIAQLPDLAHWVAPTVSVEELDKRIAELKAVQFWLEQNARVLSATIQALEVQKMTLDALKGMNLRMGDLAQAFQTKTPDSAAPATQAPASAPTGAAAAGPDKPPADPPASPTETATGAAAAAGTQSIVDPMQWWGALTSQFQQIAANAIRDAASQSASAASKNTQDTPPEPGAQGSKPPAPGAAKKPAAAAGATRKTAAAKSAARPAPGARKTPAAHKNAGGRG